MTNINEVAKEALDLHKKISLYNKRLSELKGIILASSAGRNASYKITGEQGTVRVSRRKESISYSFDTEKFQQLDKDIKDKCFKEKIVKEEIFYSLTKDKNLIENIKNKSEFNEIKNLIEEKRKEASFSVSLWQNKNKDLTKVDIIEDISSKNNAESNTFKKWIKKIF